MSGCQIRGPIYIQYPRRLSIAAGVRIQGHVHFENAGQIEIGADTSIGPGSMFFTMTHPGSFPRRDEPLGIRVGSRVMLAGAVRILPGVTIGDDATVLTASVVASDVAPGIAVASVPARPVARPKT